MMGEERFFRPKKRIEKGWEGFQRLLSKVLRGALTLLVLFLLVFMGHRVYCRLLEDPLFRIREIGVEGCGRIPQETLLSLTRLEGMPNLFTLRIKEVAKRVESHPWIEEVKISKVFPDKLLIRIEERKPIAILQLEELYYIDAKGVIFSRVSDRDGYNYPFLTGLTRQALEKDPAASKQLITKALEILKLVEKEKLFPLREISEIHMEKNFGVYCFTRNEGIELKMGWEDFGEKLKRMSIIWKDLKKRGLSAASIDCSDLKRMVVKKSL
jgi:cell division septal protein FtsQ